MRFSKFEKFKDYSFFLSFIGLSIEFNFGGLSGSTNLDSVGFMSGKFWLSFKILGGRMLSKVSGLFFFSNILSLALL